MNCLTTPRSLLAVLLIAGSTHPLQAQGEPASLLEQQPLFEAGEGGYHCYRIPALVVTRAGTVLAFAEARKNSCSDHGDIDLVLRRSEDDGQSWSERRIVADDGARTMGNPCPLVDRTTGTIWLPFCRDNRRILVTKSSDDGRTWSKPVDITRDAMDPAWHWVGTGPGHGVQLSSGRLLVPCWADATPKLGEIQLSFVFYSDDHGATWKLGGALEADKSDECEVVELDDGSVYLNARSRQAKRQRAVALSKDGGATWSPVAFDARMPEPSCQGSVVRLTGRRRFAKSRVLVCSPADRQSRSRLTVRLSYDECQTWPVVKILCDGPSAYSDMAVTRAQHVLCLYEADNYKRIDLARFNVEWLTDGNDRLRSP
jgi:sialidase-1